MKNIKPMLFANDNMTKKYIIEDGRERNRQYPETFEIPSQAEIDVLKVGDSVKMIFNEDGNCERMWVVVTEINRNDGKLFFKGKLDNKPSLESIKLGDEVLFSEEHIISIY